MCRLGETHSMFASVMRQSRRLRAQPRKGRGVFSGTCSRRYRRQKSAATRYPEYSDALLPVRVELLGVVRPPELSPLGAVQLHSVGSTRWKVSS